MELIRFPKAAENVTEGTVSRWLVKVGDRVEREQPIVELITEKAEFELPSPAAGRLDAVFAPERATVPVGYVLCVLADEAEALPDIEALNTETVARHQAELLGTAAPAVVPSPEPRTPNPVVKIAASPAARRLAREKGVDLVTVARKFNLSQPVSEEDVQRFMASGPSNL